MLAQSWNLTSLSGERVSNTWESADMKLEFGICQEEKTLLEVRECVKKCQKVLKMGSIIFPEKDIWEYEMLGPLTWIEIPENELKEMLRKYRERDNMDLQRLRHAQNWDSNVLFIWEKSMLKDNNQM